VRELQETARERDKEYQKLKVRCFELLQTMFCSNPQSRQIQLDKIKRKTLFGPTNENGHGQVLFPPNQFLDKARLQAVNNSSVNNVDLTAVVGGMEANGVRIKSFRLSYSFAHGFYRSSEHHSWLVLAE